MPCGSFDNHSDSSCDDELTQFLCAAMSTIEWRSNGNMDAYFKDTNFKECGTTKRALFGWWDSHKKEDIKRRKEEASERKLQNLRNKAISKLSASERKALGVYDE